jgi:hypothetical protein
MERGVDDGRARTKDGDGLCSSACLNRWGGAQNNTKSAFGRELLAISRT